MRATSRFKPSWRAVDDAHAAAPDLVQDLVAFPGKRFGGQRGRRLRRAQPGFVVGHLGHVQLLIELEHALPQVLEPRPVLRTVGTEIGDAEGTALLAPFLGLREQVDEVIVGKHGGSLIPNQAHPHRAGPKQPRSPYP